MKTEIVTKSKDNNHNDWKKGERGYIDGYVNGGHGAPLAVVVIGDRIELIPTNCLKVIANIITPAK